MWNTIISQKQHNVTCPFCGIACDDLSLALDQGRVESLEPYCGKAVQGFSAALESSGVPPRSNGRQVSLEDALGLSVELLKSAQAPLFAGLATDVNGMRAALELADHCGGFLDHLNGDALFRNTRVLQDNGWIACTLTEARNRADLILVIGTQCFERFPRLVERVLLPQESLFPPGSQRSLVLLGPWSPNDLPIPLQTSDHSIINVPPSQWVDVAGLLRGLVANRPVVARPLGPVVNDQLKALAKRLLDARYSIVTWSAAELDFPHAELTIQRLADLVRDLNQTTRSSVLPLAGSQGDITTNQVATWQTGYPLRTSLQQGLPVHDSRLFRYQDLIERKEADLLVWISSLDPGATPPRTDLPTIVLGHPGMTADAAIEVCIPVGVPGVDHPGHWYRSDTVCALPLGRLIERGLPSVGEVMNALKDGLEGLSEADSIC